jgi:hypothetical protein
VVEHVFFLEREDNMSELRKFIDAVNTGAVQLGKAVAAALGGQQQTSGKAVAPKDEPHTPVIQAGPTSGGPAASQPDENPLMLLMEQKDLQDKLKQSGSYLRREADEERLDEITRKLGQSPKPPPLSRAAPANGKPLPVPEVTVKPGGEVEKLLALAQSLDSIQKIPGDYPDGAHYHMTIGGKQVVINQKDVDTNRSNAQAAFGKAVQRLQLQSSNAQNEYSIYRSQMTSGWFGRVAIFIFDHVSVTDPGDLVNNLCLSGNSLAGAALAAAKGNSYVQAAKSLITADTAAQKAHALNVAYKEGIENAAERTVTRLEFVKMASEITLAVLGTPGVATALGAGGSAAAAVAVGFGGGVAITAAENLAPALAGEKVDWTKFAFDMALAFALKKLGPADHIEKAILARLGTQAVEKVGEKAAKDAFAKIMAAQMEAILKKSLETTHKALRGKDVSWDKFTEEAEKDFKKELARLVLVAVLKNK